MLLFLQISREGRSKNPILVIIPYHMYWYFCVQQKHPENCQSTYISPLSSVVGKVKFFPLSVFVLLQQENYLRCNLANMRKRDDAW